MKKIITVLIIAVIVILSSCGNNSESPFSELDGKEFVFSSGAGGWNTTLTISADGSFSGKFIDDNIGSSQRYYSSFTGKFTSPVKENEYSYKMEISELTYENPPDTEETIDGILTNYSVAYGLSDAKYLYLITPKTPISALSDGFKNWVKPSYSLDGSDILEGYALYNEADGYVFIEKTK